MTAEEPQGREPTEEEIRAAMEAEMKKITADDVVVQTIVSLVNLSGRRLGLVPDTEDEFDLEQAHTCIESVRVLLPIVEPRHGEGLKPIRDALSQLQMAYAQAARGGGQPPAADAPVAGDQAAAQASPEPPPAAPEPGGPGDAQKSGRLWVPGQ
jgi:hypothetical protein